MASVAFERVTKRYGRGQAVVSDLSLTIADKEFLVLVGPSGCGKSTALRMIAGLEDTSEGVIKIDERVVNDVAPKERDIAMVFQNYALYPHMTCYENMAFSLDLRGVPKAEKRKRVLAVAELLEIAALLDRKPKELSGGQRQRVAIGRAVVREPKVFLMDEPLSNLDAKLRLTMRTEIKNLHRRLQATFVYVTHDQTEAMTLGDRIAVMNAGKLQQCDTPHALYSRPANTFVATFIGSPQMNLLSGTLRIDGSTANVEGKGFRFSLPPREGYREGEVTIGVRPEHFVPAVEENHRLTATVEAVEPLGAEAHVYLTGGDPWIVCRVPEERIPEVKTTVAVTVAADRILLFDPETGCRLAPR